MERGGNRGEGFAEPRTGTENEVARNALDTDISAPGAVPEAGNVRATPGLDDEQQHRRLEPRDLAGLERLRTWIRAGDALSAGTSNEIADERALRNRDEEACVDERRQRGCPGDAVFHLRDLSSDRAGQGAGRRGFTCEKAELDDPSDNVVDRGSRLDVGDGAAFALGARDVDLIDRGRCDDEVGLLVDDLIDVDVARS